MTEQELKAIAKEMGYRLKKIEPSIKLLPCTCGSTRRQNSYRWDNEKRKEVITLTCLKCGKEASGYSLDEAKKNWNKLIGGEECQ